MPRKTFTVHSSVLFDPKQKSFIQNVSIEIDRQRGSIVKVIQRGDDDTTDSQLKLSPGDIDLRGKVVLPGLVDSHTHVFLHSYLERPSIEQMRDQSLVERTVRATNHARAGLLSGFTTYRDLGTEALWNADTNMRDCINRGITPGPRMFVATEALASNGSYEIRTENKVGLGLGVPRASDPCDGVDGVRAAVRRRVGDGADIIKFYADYRRKTMRFPRSHPSEPILFLPDRPNPAVPLFNQTEMNAIVAEARLADLPVAAHAGETVAALMAAKAGVTTIEHVFEDTANLTNEFFAEMKKNGCIWVPTLATAETMAPAVFAKAKVAVKKAWEQGIRLAAGGDTGVINHGLNARELELLIESGIPVEHVLEMATIGGWEACGGDRCGFRFGWFEKGNRADITALDADPRTDRKALRKVSFVMKDGKVWKQDGSPVNMITVPEFPARYDDEDDSGGSSEEWTDLDSAQPKMSMSVPLPVLRQR